MVVKEFICHCVAPLQCNSRLLWTYSGSQDHLRLQVPDLAHEAMRTVLKVLRGDPAPASMPEEGCLLYCCSNKVEFTKQMPLFD